MNRDAYGISISFFMHAFILVACLYLLPALNLQPKPLVIDFSLIPSTGRPNFYSVPPGQENDIKPPQMLQTPPEPKQIPIPKPIQRVQPEAPPGPVIVKKVLSRPAAKILPRKEEKVVNEENLPEAAESVVPPGPETLVAEPVMQQQTVIQAPKALMQMNSAAGAPSDVSKQEMEHHYVKAHFVYIKKIIEKNISYPPMARKMGWEGKVVVSFIVRSDGRVENLQVVESSGHAQLDRNALETVRQAVPFPSPPVRVKLVLPVTYTIT